MEPFVASLNPGALGRRLCLWHAPESDHPQSLIVHVHAFGEEMNKSRRMCALQARALADAGHAVLQFDLLGCGDSDGEFEDASWSAWVDDVVSAAHLAQQRFAALWPQSASPALWLWGQRTGCLVAAQALGRLDVSKGAWNLLAWQPAANGSVVLKQFLRLETAGGMFGKALEADPVSAKATLAAGGCAQIAGYGVSAALASGLDAARFECPANASAGRLEWIDVGQQAGTAPSPAAVPVLEVWSAHGWRVRHHRVAGPSFWQTTEIEEAPQLVAATLIALADPEVSTSGDARAIALNKARA